jgi:hypothetical protein
MPDRATDQTPSGTDPGAEARCPWCSEVLPSPPPSECPTCGARLEEEGELDEVGTFHLTSPPADRKISEAELDALAPEMPLSPDELQEALAPPSAEVEREMAELARRADGTPAEPPSQAGDPRQPPAETQSPEPPTS